MFFGLHRPIDEQIPGFAPPPRRPATGHTRSLSTAWRTDRANQKPDDFSLLLQDKTGRLKLLTKDFQENACYRVPSPPVVGT